MKTANNHVPGMADRTVIITRYDSNCDVTVVAVLRLQTMKTYYTVGAVEVNSVRHSMEMAGQTPASGLDIMRCRERFLLQQEIEPGSEAGDFSHTGKSLKTEGLALWN